MQSTFSMVKAGIRTLGLLMLILAAAALMVACSTTSAPVANLDVQAARYLNPDVNGRPSPLVMTIFQLKKSDAFRQASFETLMDNSGAVLQTDLIDKQTYEMQPGHHRPIALTLGDDTKYLGVVAAYRNIGQARWMRLIPIKGDLEKQTIHINLESQSVTVHVSQKKGWASWG